MLGENVKPMLKMKAGDTRLQLVKYASRFVTVGANAEITDRVSMNEMVFVMDNECPFNVLQRALHIMC